MSDPQYCPRCGTELTAGAPAGLCPGCLLRAGLASGAPLSPPTAAYSPGIPAPSPEELGRFFPQLQIIELLGKGGMGAVYKARQLGLDRLVALKILPPEVASMPAFEERFRREAKALAQLNHPNIISVFDSGQVNGLYYFIMEYVDGVNLRQAMRAGNLKPAEALKIVPQICDALQYAHDEGIVHRDIKPENILLDRRGRVKIADFGLAKLFGTKPDQGLTGTHQIMGTPHYMAPEQIQGTRDVDHRADIYSLGVTFYEMLTGELPLGRFLPPSKKVHIDVRLDDVVLRSLEVEPEKRYQHASDVKTRVEEIGGVSQVLARQLFGREFKSKATIFGIPLFHYATGVDPRTGRKRIAKGIIAVGDIAIGAVSFGGVAMGGVTFGGASVGLSSLGGVAVGLFTAIGGLAIGFIALGGGALGGIAIGGGAIGYYAFGGSGWAVHPLMSMLRDGEGVAFFEEMQRTLPYWFLFLGLIIPLLSAALFTLIWGLIRFLETAGAAGGSTTGESAGSKKNAFTILAQGLWAGARQLPLFLGNPWGWTGLCALLFVWLWLPYNPPQTGSMDTWTSYLDAYYWPYIGVNQSTVSLRPNQEWDFKPSFKNVFIREQREVRRNGLLRMLTWAGDSSEKELTRDDFDISLTLRDDTSCHFIVDGKNGLSWHYADLVGAEHVGKTPLDIMALEEFMKSFTFAGDPDRTLVHRTYARNILDIVLDSVSKDFIEWGIGGNERPPRGRLEEITLKHEQRVSRFGQAAYAFPDHVGTNVTTIEPVVPILWVGIPVMLAVWLAGLWWGRRRRARGEDAEVNAATSPTVGERANL